MREIKFRAWDKETECYLYGIQDAYDTLSGHVKYDDGENACYDEDCFGGFLDNDRYVVEQFTGLKDKNGREIYEGDVLDCINGDINTSDKAFYPGRCMGQVGFVGASFIVWPRPVVDGHRMHYGCEALSDGLTKYTWENEIAAGESVVVGNVYANPELLEE